MARDCTLPEFLKFRDTFVIYMNSAGTAIPGDAVFSHSRVHMDPYRYTDLKQRGLNIKTEITDFPKIIDFTATEKFPIHNRRLKVFKSEQKADTISFLREIIENIRLADFYRRGSCLPHLHGFYQMRRVKKGLLQDLNRNAPRRYTTSHGKNSSH